MVLKLSEKVSLLCTVRPWRSYVEGDEQPDWPNIQAHMKCCNA